MGHSSHCLLLVFSFWLGSFSAVLAGPYTFRTIDVPGAIGTSASGINARGQIVGGFAADGSSHGFLLRRQLLSMIDVPGALETAALGINTRGHIVGLQLDDNPTVGMIVASLMPTRAHIFGIQQDGHRTERGFLWANGVFTTLNVPDATATVASGINDPGQIVGFYADADGTIHGFLLDRGRFTTIDPPGSTETRVWGINVHGDLVGEYRDAADAFHGFLWENGVFTAIDVPGAFSFTTAHGINGRGQIVGFYDHTGGVSSFLLDHDGFTTIDRPRSRDLRALGINVAGTIVGEYVGAEGGLHGFVARKR